MPLSIILVCCLTFDPKNSFLCRFYNFLKDMLRNKRTRDDEYGNYNYPNQDFRIPRQTIFDRMKRMKCSICPPLVSIPPVLQIDQAESPDSALAENDCQQQDHENEGSLASTSSGRGDQCHLVADDDFQEEDSENDTRHGHFLEALFNQEEINVDGCDANNEENNDNDGRSNQNVSQPGNFFSTFSHKWKTKRQFSPGVFSILEILLMVFQIFLRHNLSETAVTDILRLLNLLLNTNIIPESRKIFQKLFSAANQEMSYHFFCESCEKVIASYEKKKNGRTFERGSMNCPYCQKLHQINLSGKNYFITISVKSQIENLLQKFKNLLNLKKSNENLTDIYDGSEYRKIKKKMKNQKFLTMTFNTDGVAVSKSCKNTLWPILLTVNELEASDRLHPSNVLIAGMYFGKKVRTRLLRGF